MPYTIFERDGIKVAVIGKINLLFKKSTRQILVSSADTISLPFEGLTAETKVQDIIRKSQREVAPVKN